MERRSLATFEKRPGKELRVTSPQLEFEAYCNEEIPMERVINIMVGDLQRIRIYPSRGFQIEQVIPDEVGDAYEQLISLLGIPGISRKTSERGGNGAFHEPSTSLFPVLATAILSALTGAVVDSAFDDPAFLFSDADEYHTRG